MKFDIKKYQEKFMIWHEYNFGKHYGSGYRYLLGCSEELGELCHAHLKGEQNIRHTPEEVLNLKKDAIGDLINYLLAYCDSQDIDIVECIELAWSEIKDRDWKNNKLDGSNK